MRLFTPVLSLVGALLILSVCAGRAQKFGVSDERKRCEAEGWTYLQTFGRPAEDTIMVFNTSVLNDLGPEYVDTAPEATAFACTDGVLTNRVFPQANKTYLVVCMQRPNGDYFSLVFTKPNLTTNGATGDRDVEFRKLLAEVSKLREQANNNDGNPSTDEARYQQWTRPWDAVKRIQVLEYYLPKSLSTPLRLPTLQQQYVDKDEAIYQALHASGYLTNVHIALTNTSLTHIALTNAGASRTRLAAIDRIARDNQISDRLRKATQENHAKFQFYMWSNSVVLTCRPQDVALCVRAVEGK
jgi:hypothetical protein